MKETFISSKEDLQWLRETHLKGLDLPLFEAAILEGNEDCPTKISLYKVNDVRCYPTVLVPDSTNYVISIMGD